VDDRLVALVFQLYLQPPEMPFDLADLFGGLTLCDQPLLGFFQRRSTDRGPAGS
jgi:hypothetical protein